MILLIKTAIKRDTRVIHDYDDDDFRAVVQRVYRRIIDLRLAAATSAEAVDIVRTRNF